MFRWAVAIAEFTAVPVLLQSFETGNLRELAAMTTVPLVQLVEAGGAPYDLEAACDPRCYADLLTPSGLREVATYAAALGLHKNLVLPDGGRTVDAAHDAGLAVHVWTVRDENRFLAERYRVGSDPDESMTRLTPRRVLSRGVWRVPPVRAARVE